MDFWRDCFGVSACGDKSKKNFDFADFLRRGAAFLIDFLLRTKVKAESFLPSPKCYVQTGLCLQSITNFFLPPSH
jgi:hypothetical protein